jgi:predicted RNase H-like nuclease (RuvC/YqgF family)
MLVDKLEWSRYVNLGKNIWVVDDLHHQIENLRNRLRDERRHINNLERRNQELNARVDFWRDSVNTRHLEFEEEMERMHKQFEEFRGMIDHQDENIPNHPRTV